MNGSQQVAILGDGQMALVLADALATQGAAVRLWSPFPEDAKSLEKTRTSRRLPGFPLPARVDVVTEDDAAFVGAALILNAIPTQYIRSVWTRLREHVSPGIPVVCVSKGIEIETLLSPTHVIADSLGEDVNARSYCALSGPTIAAELAEHQPATMVAASDDPGLSTTTQDLFGAPWLRIYSHDDIHGVELAGATKNVIALAAGMVDGLEAGDNAKSALLARGLAEIARLGAAMGARKDTFFGVAGVGDLATTCFSPCGRNRTCGERLGKGESLDDIIRTTVSVVEGVPTTKAVCELARQHDVDMPITQAVHSILFEGLAPRDAINALMHREPKAERIGG